MSGYAVRNTAQVSGAAKAALVACLFGLTACGEAKPADPAMTDAAAATQQGAGVSNSQDVTAIGAPAATQPARPTEPLDTTTWVLPPPFYAAGQEPFWRLEIVDGWFAFRRSGLRAIEEPLVQPKREGGADIFQAGSLVVSVKHEPCQTEQGATGDYTATVTYDGSDFDGCAFGGALASVSPEATQVTEALAPIDACLTKLAQPALVTAVYPRQDGEQIAVGLRAKNGQVYECATDASGSAVAYLDPIEQGSQPAWMSRMRFLRDGTPTGTPCPDAEEVRSGDKVLGRLLTKACKF